MRYLLLLAVSAWVSALLGGSSRPIPAERQSGPTYHTDIAPILREKCVPCHRNGGASPFPLSNYSECINRSRMILKVTHVRSMPPTSAVSDFDRFATFPPLTSAESLVIQKWIAAKSPEGALPASPPELAAEFWQLGQPDQVFDLASLSPVPSEGDMVRRLISFDIELAEPRWLVAFDIRPKQPKVMRRAVLAFEPNGQPSTFSPLGLRIDRVVGVWAQGFRPWSLPVGAGIALPRRSRMGLEISFFPTGKQEDAGLELALYFAKQKPDKTPQWRTLGRNTFSIPASLEFTALQDSWRFANPVRTVSIIPEARDYAKSMDVQFREVSGPQKTLAKIPNWNPRWIGALNFDPSNSLPNLIEIFGEMQYRNFVHPETDITPAEAERRRRYEPILAGPRSTDELFWIHVQYLTME